MESAAGLRRFAIAGKYSEEKLASCYISFILYHRLSQIDLPDVEQLSMRVVSMRVGG